MFVHIGYHSVLLHTLYTTRTTTITRSVPQFGSPHIKEVKSEVKCMKSNKTYRRVIDCTIN